VIRRLGAVAPGLSAARAYVAGRGRPRAPDLTGHDFIDYDETYNQKDTISGYRQCMRGGRCVFRANGSHGLAAAVEAAMGVGPLPCWLGDQLPEIERVMPAAVRHDELWLVLHRDLRHVARVRTVTEFFGREMRRLAPRMLGRPRAGRQLSIRAPGEGFESAAPAVSELA
jgi:DNA-binding transcriptional LysR family regulator